MFILRWPDESRICSRNLVWKGKFQESLFQEEVNETTVQYVGVVLDPLKPRISSKIVSGIPLSFHSGYNHYSISQLFMPGKRQ